MSAAATVRPTFAFRAALYTHGSWGSRSIEGTHYCTMELFEGDDAGHAKIEWDIPSLEETEQIGLIFEQRGAKRALVEYDGIMCLPAQATSMLRQLGIIVDDVAITEDSDDKDLSGDEVPVRIDDTEHLARRVAERKASGVELEALERAWEVRDANARARAAAAQRPGAPA